MLYNYKPSSTTNDYFNITGDSESQNLPESIVTKGKESLKIPAFGVSYGMQNQNYFQDVNVSMNTPLITEQVIKVLMNIASENLPNKEHTNEITSIGQDMYTVYANQAYQCEVKMMGCAWIQPLMYFQLNNIPLFSGAYIIHKVNHSISPNSMTTSFVGTRVARSSMKMIDSSFYYTQRQMLRDKYEIMDEKIATLTNNCNYAFYDPSSFGDENVGDIDKLVTAINYSLSKTHGLSSVTIEIENKNGQHHIIADTTNIDLKAKIFDLILQTYHSYLKEMYWVLSNQSGENYDGMWDSIQITEGNTGEFQVGVKQNNQIVSTHEGLNNEFYVSIVKFFNITDSNVDDSFKTKCNKLFSSLLANSQNNWKKKVIEFFKEFNIIIQNCNDAFDETVQILENKINIPSPNVYTPSQYQWTGNGKSNGDLHKSDKGQAAEKLERTNLAMQAVNIYYSYAKDNIKPSEESGGECAKYVRLALWHSGFEMKSWPISACAYWRYLEWWGFERIFYGFSKDYKGISQNGDIVVMAGLVNGPRGNGDKHGHIQIYCEGNWYADKEFANINVYKSGDRPCFIYRLPAKND